MGHVLPSGTFAGAAEPMFAGGGVGGGNAQIATNTLLLQGQALNAPTPNVLTLNGLPIANNVGLSNITDWSYYPAFSTINANNNKITNAGTIFSPLIVTDNIAQNEALDFGVVNLHGNLMLIGGSLVGALDIDTIDLHVRNNASVDGTLSVGGVTTLNGNTVLNGLATINANTAINGNASVNGGVIANAVTTSFLNSQLNAINVTADMDLNGQTISNVGGLSAGVGQPLSLGSGLLMNNRNVIGINTLTGSGGASVNMGSSLNLNNRNITAVNGLTATQMTMPSDAVNCVMTTNPRGNLLVNGNLPTVGGIQIVQAGVLSQNIAIPGMTFLGLVQLTYLSPTGVAQVITGINYINNSIAVNMSRATIAGESINWSVVKF